MKCRVTQVLISAQIPWASANAERSRKPTTDQVAASASSSSDVQGVDSTVEEELLGALLHANEVLLAVLKVHDRIGDRPRRSTMLLPRDSYDSKPLPQTPKKSSSASTSMESILEIVRAESPTSGDYEGSPPSTVYSPSSSNLSLPNIVVSRPLPHPPPDSSVSDDLKEITEPLPNTVARRPSELLAVPESRRSMSDFLKSVVLRDLTGRVTREGDYPVGRGKFKQWPSRTSP